MLIFLTVFEVIITMCALGKLDYLKYSTIIQPIFGTEYITYKQAGYIEQGNICVIEITLTIIIGIYIIKKLTKIMKEDKNPKPPSEE